VLFDLFLCRLSRLRCQPSRRALFLWLIQLYYFSFTFLGALLIAIERA